MFEPKAFYEPSSAQLELMEALQRRDLHAFEALLADPSVEPDHWYGKPYWATCLAVACRERDCEAFILALLRAGAGTTKGVASSSSSVGLMKSSSLSLQPLLSTHHRERVLKQTDATATRSVPGSTRHTFQESHSDKPFLVEPSVLKSTVEMAMNTEKDASKADEVLQAVRATCLQMEDLKERIENDIHACIQQIERFELQLNSIEQAQRRNNNVLIQIMEIISSQPSRRESK